MKKKKREFQSSELVKSFAKIHGFESKLLAFEIKDFLNEYLNDALFSEIESVNLNKKILKQILPQDTLRALLALWLGLSHYSPF